MEGAPLTLPLHEEPHRHRLDAARGELRRNLLPEERRDRVADEAIQDAPRLLRPHQVLIDGAGGVERLANRPLRDLVEDDPGDGDAGAQRLDQVPADALSLAVLIGCDHQLLGLLEKLPELCHHLLLAGGDDVERLEPLLHVDAQPGPVAILDRRWDLRGRFGKIAHMAHGGRDPVLVREEGPDGPRLGGRFHHHQPLLGSSSRHQVRPGVSSPRRVSRGCMSRAISTATCPGVRPSVSTTISARE
jgi:hypothetical protein